MNALQDRRVQIAVGSAAALLVVILVAVFMVASGRAKTPPPEIAQHGMLQVEMGKGDMKMDPAKPLRCFVGGQFVGEATLADCAKKNGVAAQNLDVGLDSSGQVAGASGADAASLAPLPEAVATPPAPKPAPPAATAEPAHEAASTSAAGGQCLAFAGGNWSAVAEGVSLTACTHILYDRRCVRPGDALYGRFGPQTLRLVPGKVEVSNDNRAFRFLADHECNLDR